MCQYFASMGHHTYFDHFNDFIIKRCKFSKVIQENDFNIYFKINPYLVLFDYVNLFALPTK